MLKILRISLSTFTNRSLSSKQLNVIQEVALRSENRDQIYLVDLPASSRYEFQRLLIDLKPTVIHFTGDNTIKDNHFTEDRYKLQQIPKDLLIYVKILNKNIKLVVFDGYYSEEIATEISNYVNCVIGITNLNEEITTFFLQHFYEISFRGESIGEAFEKAKLQAQQKFPNIEQHIHIKTHLYVEKEKIYILENLEDKFRQYVRTLINYIETDLKSSGDYSITKYIPDRKAVFINIFQEMDLKNKKEFSNSKINNWLMTDQEIEKKYEQDIVDANIIVERFLNECTNDLLIIGGSLGIGKTIFIKELFLQVGNQYLNKSNDYVPIFISPNKEINTLFMWDDIYRLLDEIEPNKKILLIYDGLDEHEYKKILYKLDQRKTKNKNLKVILTTRLVSDFPQMIYNTKEKYLRLLPFTKQQVNSFLEHNNINLNYEEVIQLGMNDEELRKPLFLLILSKILPNMQDNILIGINTKLTVNKRKALMYMQFINYSITHRLKEYLTLDTYNNERKILRTIAMWIQLKGEITEMNLQEIIQIHRLNTQDFDLESILKSHFSLITNTNKVIEFIHSSIKDYLVAEIYVECLLKGNAMNLNIGIPTKETINFLDGLISLLKIDDVKIESLIEFREKNLSLFNSFEFKDSKNTAIKNIINNAIQNINEKSIYLNNYTVSMQNKNYVVTKNDNSNGYPNLWIYKYISLYVFNLISSNTDPSNNIDKKSLVKLITSTSQMVPSYLKQFSNIDLSDMTLSAVKLSFANLSNANLSKSDLSGSNLYGANLNGVNLEEADLSGANLARSTLTSSNCQKTNFFGTILYQANLSNSKLMGALFTGSHLNNAIFNKSNMQNSIIYACTAFYSKFNDVNLNGSDLGYSNFPGAEFQNVDLSTVNFEGANLYKVKVI